MVKMVSNLRVRARMERGVEVVESKGLLKDAESYLRLKQELIEAVDEDRREDAKRLYKEWLGIIDILSAPVHRRSKDDIEGVLFDLTENTAQAGLLAEELWVLSEQEFSREMSKAIEQSVDEIVELFYEGDERKKWRKQLLEDTKTTNIRNFLPEDYFSEANFEEKREYILGRLAQLSETVLANGEMIPDMGIVTLKFTHNLLNLPQISVHEYLHYFGDKGELKMDPRWEFTTYGGSFAHRIVRIKEKEQISLEQAEQKVLELMAPYADTPELAEALYRGGKVLAGKEKDVFSLKLAGAGKDAGYVSIDKLVEEVIEIYDKEGISSDELKLYLHYSANPPQTPTEEALAQSVRYGAQRAVGILLAGVFVAQWQTQGIEPLINMRDYFKRLSDFFAPATEGDKEWIDKKLLPNLRRFLQTHFGSTNIDLSPAKDANELGLWKYKRIDSFDSRVEYLRMSLIPGGRDDPNRAPYRKEVEELGQSHIVFSRYRFLYAPDDNFNAKHKEDLDNEAFEQLWEFMLIPSCVFKGDMGIRKGDRNLGLPPMIKKVFTSLFDLGDADIEKQIFESYSLPQQYINSLLYIYSHYEGKDGEKFNDPRLEPEGEIEKALVKTYEGGWKDILYKRLSEEELFRIVKERIWPVYKELYDKAEKDKAEQKKKEAKELADKLKKGISQMGYMPPQMGAPKPGRGRETRGEGRAGEPKAGKSKDGKRGKPSDKEGKKAEGESKKGKGKSGKSKSGEAQPSEMPLKDIDNSTPPAQRRAPSRLSELEPPPDADTLKKILDGDAGKSSQIPKAKQALDSGTQWDLDRLDQLHEQAIRSTGLTSEEYKIYQEWKRQIPQSLMDQAKDALNLLLLKYLGLEFKPSDDMADELVDPVAVRMAQPGTARQVKRKPFTFKFIFLPDKSGSMKGERILRAKLLLMLFLENFIDADKDYGEHFDDIPFQWMMIPWDEIMERLGGDFEENNNNLKRLPKERIIYDMLTALDGGNWTDDKKAFLTSIGLMLKQMNQDEEGVVYFILGFTDGNFGTNPELAELLEQAEAQDVYVRVASTGDETANRDVVTTFGKERSLIPSTTGALKEIPGLCWDSLFEILEDKLGRPLKQTAYSGDGGQKEINPQLKRVFDDIRAKDYAFLEGWGRKGALEEGRRGRLFETLHWIEADEIDTIFRKEGDGIFDLEALEANGKKLFKKVPRERYMYAFRDGVTEADFAGDENEEKLRELFAKHQDNLSYGISKISPNPSFSKRGVQLSLKNKGFSGRERELPPLKKGDRGGFKSSRRVNLNKQERYYEWLLKALREAEKDFPEIAKYDVVIVRNADFSGHFSYKRGGRLYVPLEFLEMVDELEMVEELDREESHRPLKDFLSHEYLESLLSKFEEEKGGDFSDREWELLDKLIDSDIDILRKPKTENRTTTKQWSHILRSGIERKAGSTMTAEASMNRYSRYIPRGCAGRAIAIFSTSGMIRAGTGLSTNAGIRSGAGGAGWAG